jgi:hypothetical protein
MTTTSVNVVVGRRMPWASRKFAIDSNAVRLVFHDEEAQNIQFGFEDIEESVGELDSLVKDLLDIAVAVYMSDQYVERDSNLNRRISMLIPVRNLGRWEAAKNTLVRTIAFLIQNEFDMHFVQGDDEPSKFKPYEPKDSKRCVCLLSGGLDSAAGAVWLNQERRKPFFVSHWSSPKLKGFQDNVRKSLETNLKRNFKHCSARIHPSYEHARFKLDQEKEKQMVQFSRSFLYVSLGCAVALALKLKDVYVCENGPMALNVPISESRLNTRTVHPKFLAFYARLIKEIFGVELAIQNPFAYDTKGKVVSLLKQKKLEELVKVSCSCWKYPWVPAIARRKGKIGFKGKHCGECYPCVMRRISLHAAGLSSVEDAAKEYIVDVFGSYPPDSRESITVIADLLRFAHDLKSFALEDILVRYPDFSVSVEGAEPAKLVEMYKQFADEATRAFSQLGNNILRNKYGFLLQ